MAAVTQQDIDRHGQESMCIVEMDKAGYSHKPLLRVSMKDQSVLDMLENYGAFEFTLDTRKNLKYGREYACWLTDPKDLDIDSPFLMGTSCVLINPVVGGWAIQRHSHDGKWETIFGTFKKFEWGVQQVEQSAKWVNVDRAALAQYRKRKEAA